MLKNSVGVQLYDPSDEHDACGVGFIANISGIAAKQTLDAALEALSNLSHRGAIDADGKTSDGAGLLCRIPYEFFRQELDCLGFLCPFEEELGVGMIFLPNDTVQAEISRKELERTIASHGLVVLAWRKVPTDETILGPTAISTAPGIEQIFVARGSVSNHQFEASLQSICRASDAQFRDFYICSLSSRTIVYKGMVLGNELAKFYRDLESSNFKTSMAVFHQRYSTNTSPNWSLAQPFRMLAHNGEINTITGNRAWMRARSLATGSSDSHVWFDGSDSATLDRAATHLISSGRDLLETLITLIPEQHDDNPELAPELRAFYEYMMCEMEPWDGPAAIAYSDGCVVGAALDRNGLRPARYIITNDDTVIVSSEAGAVSVDPEQIKEKGRLGPGGVIAVDLQSGRLLKNNEIKTTIAAARPYRDLVRHSIVALPELHFDNVSASGYEDPNLTCVMKSFGFTAEDVHRILEPMMAEGKEPIGSMGDDTPLAVLSSKPRLLYSYFKQRFAQVTNPAIDPIRERLVMSLQTMLGCRRDPTSRERDEARFVKARSPILSDAQVEWLKGESGLRWSRVDASFDCSSGAEGLERRLSEIQIEAEQAIETGVDLLLISDLNANRDRAAVPMLLAVGAVHNHLIRSGRRMKLSIIAQTCEARDEHQIACLIGCGANAVCPSLAFRVIEHQMLSRGGSTKAACQNYRKALEDGLLKVMAKMGIATVSSYCGALTFEIIGLNSQLVDSHFGGIQSKIGGIGIREIATDIERFHLGAYEVPNAPLEDGGYFRYRNGGEFHTFNPAVFRSLHRAARDNRSDVFQKYSAEVDSRQPACLRDLLSFRGASPIPLEEVEPIEAILKRFSTSGMSLGALSREAHEALAVAMNRMGARSNSGEGGEDSVRFKQYANGDSSNSRIKQVASARFGVTPEYLVSADELEIKIAQGSKPGEGGQLPGHKVSKQIATLRHSIPGITLISPPPHHDIYSIEDLAQLIYDLRQVNPDARIAVKLVAETGIGAVVSGVAKAGADVIHISGHDGGTGASPLTSIKNAGAPWEMGLAEARQSLEYNGLRKRVRLRVDGGLKSARDVMIAALLGADEFGFATAAVVALGCVMARQCHLNTCPVGIATQDANLRRRFTGKAENVVHFFVGLANEVRQLLADLGIRGIDEIVGRSDLLHQHRSMKNARATTLDLTPLVARIDMSARQCREKTNDRVDSGWLGLACEHACRDAIARGSRVTAEFEIRNTDRAVGARVAGSIARRYGNAGLPKHTIDLVFRGSAGQSFGAFNVNGMRLTLIGEANDYVGKGMNGGEIVVRSPRSGGFDRSAATIIGNTVMYGATGGRLFVAGKAGERFCVRNSGGTAVVEGVGDHGCEYMTGGLVIVLGEVGRNFAAGMTGGEAYVLNDWGGFQRRCNSELADLTLPTDQEQLRIRKLIARHYRMTLSPRAREVLSNWDLMRLNFVRVVTRGSAAPSRAIDISSNPVSFNHVVDHSLAEALSLND